MPVAMAQDEEDARRVIEMADEMFELENVVGYEIEIDKQTIVASCHN